MQSLLPPKILASHTVVPRKWMHREVQEGKKFKKLQKESQGEVTPRLCNPKKGRMGKVTHFMKSTK